MRVRFGLHLDGQRGWHLRDLFGEEIVGPLGFLTVLETNLGLTSAPVPHSQRVLHYRDALQAANHDHRFYTRSLLVDELGVAADLLGWRDLWFLHGWNGQKGGMSSGKLADLADVEAAAKDTLAPSIGERLLRIEARLGQRDIPLEEVILVDPLSTFPLRWQRVLTKLPVKEGCVDHLPSACRDDRFLGKLQRVLREASQAGECKPLPFVNDGSFRVVEADTSIMAARWLAAQVNPASSLLVAPRGGELLDEFLEGSGEPTLGLDESSPFRPVLQILPLALELLWQPVDPEALMHFLSHPLGPLPVMVRQSLAEALASQPGVGGRTWQSALDRISKYYLERDPDKREDILEKIRFWSATLPRYSRDSGAPVAAVLEVVLAITNYVRVRLATAEGISARTFATGLQHLESVRGALESMQSAGIHEMRLRQIQQLLRQATQGGASNPTRYARVGAIQAVTHPGAAIESFDRVVWWHMSMPELPGHWPWSPEEIHDLAMAGVELPSVEVLLSQAANEWLRPLCAARSELVIMRPPVSLEQHPVWQMIEVLVEGLEVTRLESLLASPAAEQTPVPHQPLPQLRRYWNFDTDLTIHQREKESYSSLEKLLFNPYHWLLQYPARIRASRRTRLPGSFLLYGNLAHGLVERFLVQHPLMTVGGQDFEDWFQCHFDELITQEGAALRLPGWGNDLQDFRISLRRALKRLLEELEKARVCSVQPEKTLSGCYSSHRNVLEGSADLVLQRENGDWAVLDMKWSGSKKYRDKLETQSHLQLVMYAELLRQMEGSLPAIGYFILDQARLLAMDSHWFPDASIVTPKEPLDHGDIWSRFIRTWAWRQDQFRQGRVEVALKEIGDLDHEPVPEEGLAMEVLNPQYNDYRFLAGWGG